MVNLINVLLFVAFLEIIFANHTNSSVPNQPVVHASFVLKNETLTFTDYAEPLWNFGRLGSPAELRAICVAGPWIIYPSPNFVSNNADSVQVASGVNKCIKSNTTKIGSMQSIGTSYYLKDAITLFEKSNYSSLGQPHAPEGKRQKKFKSGWLPSVGSLITQGHASWSLFDYSGGTVCIRPSSAEEFGFPICFLSNTRELQLHKRKFAGVYRGCLNLNERRHENETSSYYRVLDLIGCVDGSNLELTQTPNLSPKVNEIGDLTQRIKSQKSEGPFLKNTIDNCRSTLDINSKKDDNDNDQTLNLEKIRQFAYLRYSHDFSSRIQTLWPEGEENLWKTTIIDTIYSISSTSIPEDIVPSIYLNTLRELFVYQLDLTWKNEKGSRLESSQIDVLQRQLSACSVMVVDYNSRIKSLLMEPFLEVRNPTNLSSYQRPEFLRDRTLDHVIDTTWIVANFARSLCYHLLDANPSFEQEFVKVVDTMYFHPLANEWRNPTISHRSYAAIFGGFGITSLHSRLNYATAITFQENAGLNPFRRLIS